MPIYTYRCEDCDGVFEIFHLMSEVCDACTLCGSSDNLERIPSMLVEKINMESKPDKVGDLVESHIRQAREELKKEKKNLKNKEV